MKNITLSAPEEHINKARQKAASKGTTLNNEFRAWLSSQTSSGQQQADKYQQALKKLAHVDAGRKFSRQEMNER